MKDEVLSYIRANYKDNKAIGIDDIVKYANIYNKHINHGYIYKLLIQLRSEGEIHIIKKYINTVNNEINNIHICIYVIPI